MLFTTFLSAVLCTVLQATAVAAARSKGCGKAVASNLIRGGVGLSNTVSFTTSSGAKRTFLLHIPTKYDVNTATPLIFHFHGRGNTDWLSEVTTRYSDEKWNPDHIVVYPNGLKNQWQGDPDATGYNDVGFVLDMINSLEDQFCIDAERIYSSGHSNGAGFSLSVLACDPTASTKIAAFVGSAPAAYQGTTEKNCNGATVPIICNPGRSPVPILSTHGTADEVIPYNGGPRRGRCLPSAAHFSTEWARRNGLSTANVSTILYDGKVQQQRFHVAPDGVLGKVVHYWIKGFSHNWPQVADGGQFDLTPVALRYFRRFTLTKDAGPDGNAASSSSTYATATASPSPSPSPSKYTVSQQQQQQPHQPSPPTSTAPIKTLCPAYDDKIYTSANRNRYKIHCAYDSSGKTLATQPTYPGSFMKCIAQCDVLPGCLSVAYDGACYLKGAPGNLVQKGSAVNRVAVKVA